MDFGIDLLFERLKAHSPSFHQVVDFDAQKEKLVHFDFTNENKELDAIDLTDTTAFADYITAALKKGKAKFGIGGYNEDRVLYKRSQLFDSKVTPRTLHLGVDIWGEEGTKVYAPLGGMVHSFGYNNNFGDYGATLILLHQIDSVIFYTLYGHLSLDDIARVTEFQYIIRGQVIGHFGKPEENGNWPPHLHFQIIKDMNEYSGDYPGVCSVDEAVKYLSNSGDPDVILNMLQFVKSEG